LAYLVLLSATGFNFYTKTQKPQHEAEVEMKSQVLEMRFLRPNYLVVLPYFSFISNSTKTTLFVKSTIHIELSYIELTSHLCWLDLLRRQDSTIMFDLHALLHFAFFGTWKSLSPESDTTNLVLRLALRTLASNSATPQWD